MEPAVGGAPAGDGTRPPLDLGAPIVVTGRGGSGTRLFSKLLQQLQVDLGNDINHTEDSVEWVDVIYRLAIAKLSGSPAPDAADALRANATAVAGHRRGRHWGWKLPETVLLLPEVAAAFERCRIVHVTRHPLDTCLRRTHMTSRPNNRIGQAVLGAAYAALGWARDPAADPEHVCNAAAWWFQVREAHAFLASLPGTRAITVRYESLCDAPDETAARIACFVGVGQVPVCLDIDRSRRRLWSGGDPRIAEVWGICGDVAQALGYRADGSTSDE